MLKIHHASCVALWLVEDGPSFIDGLLSPKLQTRPSSLPDGWWCTLICCYVGPLCEEEYRSAVKVPLSTQELLQTTNVNIPSTNKRATADSKCEYPFYQQKNYCRQQTWISLLPTKELLQTADVSKQEQYKMNSDKLKRLRKIVWERGRIIPWKHASWSGLFGCFMKGLMGWSLIENVL